MDVAKTRQNAANGNLKKMMITAGIALCIVISVALLYPALRNYYLAYRVNEQLLQELSAVEERNDQILRQIAYLNTPEGIADRSRERFGWVPLGEQAVNITGLEVLDSSTQLPGSIPVNSGTMLKTWWTEFCDLIFGVEQETVADPIPDPFITTVG
ncbi:MAG: hypothetical protein LBP91_05090 [Coriobacteriales bacterium]|jgi:cell division protein FtsB|nr:hypothetical protein [Coriobacteriales bacterium]